MVSSRRLQDYNWSQSSNLASYRQPREISRIISLCNRIPEMTLLFDVIGGQGLRYYSAPGYNMTQNSNTSKKACSISRLNLDIILLIIMVIILSGMMIDMGNRYTTWTWMKKSGVEGVSTTEDNLCPNGAAEWIVHYSIYSIGLLVVVSIIGLAKMIKMNVIIDLSKTKGVLAIVRFPMLIWGSTVVFGAWANWTDDFDAYKANPEELNFCAHTPMMTAFVILILKWVRESLKNLWCGRRMYFFCGHKKDAVASHFLCGKV